jgi:hypothetical protein
MSFIPLMALGFMSHSPDGFGFHVTDRYRGRLGPGDREARRSPSAASGRNIEIFTIYPNIDVAGITEQHG